MTRKQRLDQLFKQIADIALSNPAADGTNTNAALEQIAVLLTRAAILYGECK